VEVNEFTYLESKMSNMGDGEVEILARLAKTGLYLTQEHMEGRKHPPEDQAQNLLNKCYWYPPLRIRVMEDDQNHQ
jgi:hypothetical protein